MRHRLAAHVRAVALAALGFVAPGLPAGTAVAQGVQVLRAEVGRLAPPDAAGRQAFTPARVLPLRDGQEFAWRLVVQTRQPFVRVREELTLPAEPRTWGDPEPDIRRRTTPDGRTAITEWRLAPRDGVLQSAWTVTAGDPPGTWVLTLTVEDQPPRVFRLQARPPAPR
ncbi:MAG: hypothetical protein ACK5Y8_07440 [Betaproteobacteria bacterium]|jgi:hypothetical protein|nr:hypothetical protein [Rubrivivax sp.]